MTRGIRSFVGELLRFSPTFLARLAAADDFPQSLFDQFPWLQNLLLFFATLALIALIVWFVKGKSPGRGFLIHVDEHDITFTGLFPPQMQAAVIEFLRYDVALPGEYQIRGHWEDRILIVVVQGDHARPMEQRIRNFLKLNLKPPA